MLRNLAIGLAASLTLAVAPARSEGPGSGRPSQVAPDYKVVFWFGREGLKHQVYDVRKGEYTQAVDDWVFRLDFDASGYVLPGPLATVRDVNLADEPGKSAAEKLASAIAREEGRILGYGSPATVPRRPAFLAEPRPALERDVTRRRVLRPTFPERAPGDPGLPTLWGPAPPPFPFPYPYPRPHP